MEANLEALIAKHAATMADEMPKIAGFAESEEEVRIGCTKLIDNFIGTANLKMKGRHEYGLAGGRIDSKYGGVVIEYKDPNGAGKLSENQDSPGVRAVVAQIQRRFTDLQREEQVGMERILGVGCDGNYMVFVSRRGREFDISPPSAVTPYVAQKLLRALVSLSARGHSFTPENLSADFGEKSTLAQEGIHSIYEVICETESAKAQTFFKQWQILFGEVCGYDIHGRSSRIDKLGSHYLIPYANPAQLLFAVHTYYALLIKLLAAEIVASLSPLGLSTLKKLFDAPTSEKLRLELQKLERGGIWKDLGIRNFLEGDLFSWYIDAWDERLAQAIRSMVDELNKYDPNTLSVEPSESRDLLKKLYQRLFPKTVRHDLGEYFTPDWLAEFTLNELGYDGNPDKRLLDPACGSGTFLVMTINRIKAWFDEHRHECGFQEDELLRKILRNVIGFDLNPLAVMASRTNYLLAIRDLLRYGGEIELPVYLCDSIMTPSQYGDVFTESLRKARKLKTSAGDFLIPTEVTSDRERIGKYADELEKCVRSDYDPNEFISRCEAQGLPMAEKALHKQLYRRLRELDAGNENGIWARIIKNAFAPLFIKKVDYVAGNPPWVNWDYLPHDYRDSMKPLWANYGLFTLSGFEGRLGGGKKDLCMIFVFAVADNYLSDLGLLAFVMKQRVFKSAGAGDGFRRLAFNRDRIRYYLKPTAVHDFGDMQIFEGATNRTAVFVCQKGKNSFAYPVPYYAWSGPRRVPQDQSLVDLLAITKQVKLDAVPVLPQKGSSPWLTATECALQGILKVVGQSGYQAHLGVNTGGLNGCFWIRVIERLPNGELLIENLPDAGEIEVKKTQAVIEQDLVFPLVRSRDVSRWKAGPSCYIILAQDPNTRAGIPESIMKAYHPKTYAYLKQFEGDVISPKRGTLRGRSLFRKIHSADKPFYSMYGVGPYSISPIKALWRQFMPELRVSVIQTVDDPFLGTSICLTQHVVTLVSFDSTQEAFFFSGLGNSSPSVLLHSSLSTGKSYGQPNVLQMIAIPEFDRSSPLHRKISNAAEAAHMAALCQRNVEILELECQMDEYAGQIWSITPCELAAIREALGKE